jgi:hypothetical protein
MNELPEPLGDKNSHRFLATMRVFSESCLFILSEQEHTRIEHYIESMDLATL